MIVSDWEEEPSSSDLLAPVTSASPHPSCLHFLSIGVFPGRPADHTLHSGKIWEIKGRLSEPRGLGKHLDQSFLTLKGTRKLLTQQTYF